MPKTEEQSEKSGSGPAKFAKGLEGVVAAQTALSLVDGEASQLYYRGIPIHELAENSSYEETVFLLWNGKLPAAAELADFKRKLATYRPLSANVLDFLKAFPKKAHPMSALRSAVSLLGLFDPDVEKIDTESSERQAFRLTAVFPTLIAAFHRLRLGKDPLAPDKKLSHAANFLYMMHGNPPEKEMERALDAYLILLADHGLNASTFSARVTAATESDMVSAITSAVGTLKGPLHGAANQRAMEMILDIDSPDRAEGYVRNLLAQ